MGRKSKELSDGSKDQIVSLFQQGISLHQIGKRLKIPYSTVQFIVKKFRTSSTDNLKRSGRPKSLSERDVRTLVKIVSKNPKTSAPELATHLASSLGKIVTPQTVRNRLHRQGYKARTPRNKPYISKINRQKRLEFAKANANKPMEFWRNVLFTDESKFNIFGSDGRKLVWRKPNTELDPQNTNSTVKHGGGHVMIWGSMSSAGVGELAVIDGIMNADKYIDILRCNLAKSVQKLGIENSYFFQQDNDPKHTAHKTKEWLLYNARKVFPTPPQSPDINPIENLWSLLEVKLRKLKCSSRRELIDNLQKCWLEITTETTENLVKSMPRRLQAVVNAKGGPTKY